MLTTEFLFPHLFPSACAILSLNAITVLCWFNLCLSLLFILAVPGSVVLGYFFIRIVFLIFISYFYSCFDMKNSKA